MANLRITPYNHHDDATLSVTGATATGFFVTDTQNCIRSKVWRATSSAGQAIKGTLAASRSASSFFVFLHNSTTIRLQLFSDAAWVTQVYDSTALSATPGTADSSYDWGLGTTDPLVAQAPFYVFFAPVSFQSYTITFASGATHQVSRIFLGKAFECAINPSYGLTLGFMSDTDRNRSRGGSLRTNLGASWRTMQFDLQRMNENERAAWVDIMRYCGLGRDVAVSLFPGIGTRRERDYTFNGKFSSLDAIGRQVSWLTKRVQLEEV